MLIAALEAGDAFFERGYVTVLFFQRAWRRKCATFAGCRPTGCESLVASLGCRILVVQL